jgi:hypothetical protein
MDAGGVAKDFQNIISIYNNKYAERLGSGIACNISIIHIFDYAISNEEKQFPLNIGHTFLKIKTMRQFCRILSTKNDFEYQCFLIIGYIKPFIWMKNK